MKIFALIGWPVAHSCSPAMQNAAFAELGIDAHYGLYPVREEDLGDAMHDVCALGIEGGNVTVPHKRSVMAFIDDIDSAAARIGAVNTFRREGRRLVGSNTDAQGLLRSLQEANVDLYGARVLVLGAGGAARAAAVAAVDAGAARITVAARRPVQAESLLAHSQIAGESISIASCENVIANCNVLIQATSATMQPELAQPFVQSLPVSKLPPSSVVVDLVYSPRETLLLRRCADLGHQCVGGIGMLLHQGALAFEYWTSTRAPIEVMRAALEHKAGA